MKKKKLLIPALILIWSVLLLALSWKVAGFSDFYVRYVFPIWANTYGRVFGYLPFSAGELLIYGGVVYAILTILTDLAGLVLFALKKPYMKGFLRTNNYVFLCIVTGIVFLQVQNCFVLYHTTPIYEGTVYGEYASNKADLFDLREKLVKRANELSLSFERDSKGNILYSEDIGEKSRSILENMGRQAADRLENGKGEAIDKWLVLLKGIYTRPKPFLKSDFFSQQGIMGYYFPFSLEANYNDLMYIANYPDVMCHELSHLKGFIFEDEASFLAYLAGTGSGDTFFEYSAILNALGYVYQECEKEIALNKALGENLTPVNIYVAYDSNFLTQEAWDEVEKDAVLKTEDVNAASEAFLDTNLTMNGVSDGIESYSRIVDLLLKYYYGGEINENG